MKNRAYILYILTAIAFLLASCSKDSIHGDGFYRENYKETDDSQREAIQERRNLLLLYSAGYNSLSSYLKEDIEELLSGWLPGSWRSQNILLIYSHATVNSRDYKTPSSPTLTRVCRDVDGTLIKDTLVVYPDNTHSATPEQMHEVLSYIQRNFPSKSYGMIFSSHGNGYLPAGYYSDPDKYVFTEKKGLMPRQGEGRRAAQPVPYVAPEHDPSLPEVKSIGQDLVGGNLSYEIDLDDFAEAIPMYMEYILFDACLMGGVEVAYELKDKCKYVGFSQTEVLAEGFDYKTITEHLLKPQHPDPQGVCEDYFTQYDTQQGIMRSATISMADCTQMEPLAQICKTLFEKYREGIANLSPYFIQRYYRGNYHWFYDLEDIIDKAGASDEELEELRSALGKCLVYKASTPEFMVSFEINTYSGFSMYLPCDGSAELDKYYKTLSWNKATGLVK
jgi:hypothetical protein